MLERCSLQVVLRSYVCRKLAAGELLLGGLTSEFLGWVVEVACVWLDHAAVVHKPVDTTIMTVSESSVIYTTKKNFQKAFNLGTM